MTPPRKKSPLSSSVRRLGADADMDAGKEKVSAIAVCVAQWTIIVMCMLERFIDSVPSKVEDSHCCMHWSAGAHVHFLDA